MRYINLNNAHPGMLLGKNVEVKTLNGSTMILLKSGVTLTENMIKSLQLKEIKGIYIDDELSKDIIIESAIDDQTHMTAMNAIRNKDIEGIINSSKMIAEQIYKSKQANINLIRIIETKDKEGHSMNVCELAVSLGRAAGFDLQSLENIAMASLFHDLGKFITDEERKQIFVPDNLKKRCKDLGIDEEYYLHPYYGYAYLSKISNTTKFTSAVVRQAVLFHHENEIGEGFYMAKPECITDISRIITICDQYEKNLQIYENPIDARTSLHNDYYNKKMSYKYMDLFYKKIPIYPIGTTVKLSTGDYAIIVKNNSNYPEYPVVRLIETTQTIDLLEMQNMNVTIVELFCENQQIEIKPEELEKVK